MLLHSSPHTYSFPLVPVLQGTREGAAAILTEGPLLQHHFILYFSNRNGDRASPSKRRGASVSHTTPGLGCRGGSGMGSSTHLVSRCCPELPLFLHLEFHATTKDILAACLAQEPSLTTPGSSPGREVHILGPPGIP